VIEIIDTKKSCGISSLANLKFLKINGIRIAAPRKNLINAKVNGGIT